MEKIDRCQKDIISRITKSRIYFMKLQKEQLDKCYIETRLEILDRNWKTFMETHKSILDTITSVEAKASSYKTELKQAEELYVRYRNQLQDVISSFQSNEKTYKTSISDLGLNSSLQSEDFNCTTKSCEIGNVNVYHNPKSQLSSCTYCDSISHNIGNCNQFSTADFDARRHFVQTRKLCHNCLGANHSAHSCRHSFRCRLCQMKHHVLLHPTILQSTNHNLEVKHALVDKNVVEHASTREHKEINSTHLPTEKVDVLRKSQLEVTSSTEIIVKASHSVGKGVVKQATSAASSNDELSQACISTSHCQLTLTSALVQAQSESGFSKEELTILRSKKKVVVLSYLPSNCDGVTSSGSSNKDKKSLETKIRAQASKIAFLSCSNQKQISLGNTSSCKGVADKGINTSIQEVAVSSGLGAKRKEICEALPNKELNKNHGVSMVGGNSCFFILPTDGATGGVKKFMSNSRYSPQRVEAKKNVESDQILCNFIISVITSVTSVQMAMGRITKTLEKYAEQRAKLNSFHRTRIKKLLHGRLAKRKCSCFTQKLSSM